MVKHSPAKATEIDDAEPLVGPVPAPELHVMSWNIRRRTSLPTLRRHDRWSYRQPGLSTLLTQEKPHLLGAQEARADQLHSMLEALGPLYRTVGTGRGVHGAGEHNPVIYRADRLQLLHWEQQALSSQPQRPGSRDWGNLIPRILVLATFLDLGTGSTFQMINTHWDHLSAKARTASAQRILELVRSTDVPTVLTGDFNAAGSSSSLQLLISEPGLQDTWGAADNQLTAHWNTFANYRRPRATGRRLDWIFASPQLPVSAVAVNNRQYQGVWPSDHLPVHAVLQTLPEPERR